MRGRPLLLRAGALALALALSGCPKPAVPPTPTPVPIPTPTPVPTPPPPPPPPYVPARKLEVGKIFNGMQYRVTLETEYGRTASIERSDMASYVAELTVKVKVPKPHKSIEDLSRLNDQLPVLLPGLTSMLENAGISPVFDELYRLKCSNLQANLNRLDTLLTRHNFFDCETIIELRHPESKRRALLLQADMDTDMDGSDSDRMPEIDGSSATFQPMTSYRWAKKGKVQNSFIPPREAKVKQYEAELAQGGVTAARKEELKSARDRLKGEIGEMNQYSFLLASNDPYIVLPSTIFSKAKAGQFAPTVGDYCVVIHGSTLFPAIVGDVGPAAKAGEASLRIGKQILPKTNADYRAVSDLKVTYLVFPGTADRPWDVPDLAKWRTRCEALLGEIGGYKGELFTWEDLTKPPPTPPADAPAPAPAASPATPPPATPAPRQ